MPSQDEFINSWLASLAVLVVGLISGRTAVTCH